MTRGAEVVVGKARVDVVEGVVKVDVELEVGAMSAAPKSGVEGVTEVGFSIKAPPDWISDEVVATGVVEGGVDEKLEDVGVVVLSPPKILPSTLVT